MSPSLLLAALAVLLSVLLSVPPAWAVMWFNGQAAPGTLGTTATNTSGGSGTGTGTGGCSGVIPGSYSNANITVNVNGCITAASSGSVLGGDVSSNTATSVVDEVALFASTTGKIIKRATGSGLVKLTAGVQSIATPGADYVVPGGTVATATAFVVNGTNCAAGQFPVGVDAQGNAEGCTVPAGAGDVSSNTAVSVDGEISLFSGTTGKVIKRAIGTGIVKLTAGVQSIATPGTDYVVAGGNVATATALAANGANCPTGQFAAGVNAAGVAEGCAEPVASNTGISVDGEVALFSSTTGKVIKRATGTGIVKLTAGVQSVATPGTDYVVPGETVATATALAANGANCPSGQFPLGVDAAGVAEGCVEPIPGIADISTILTTVNVKKVYGKQNVVRVVPYTPAGSPLTVQLNCDDTDIATIDALAGDLTMAAPLCTGSNPEPEQELEVRFSSTTPRLITWNAVFCEDNGIPRFTSTSGLANQFDRIKFRRNALSACWGVISTTRGVGRGVTTLASSTTFVCDPRLASLCEMQMTDAAGTLIVQITSGATVPNGTLLRMAFLCTNAQSFNFDAVFVPSPNVPKPVTCPSTASLSTPAWTEVGVRFSTVLGNKWQILATN